MLRQRYIITLACTNHSTASNYYNLCMSLLFPTFYQSKNSLNFETVQPIAIIQRINKNENLSIVIKELNNINNNIQSSPMQQSLIQVVTLIEQVCL